MGLVDREALLPLLKTLAPPHPSLIMLSLLTPAANVQTVTFVSSNTALVCEFKQDALRRAEKLDWILWR